MKESRRHFLSKCLGVPAALSTAAIRPKTEIPSDFPKPKFHFGQEIEHTLIFDDGEVSVQVGVIIGMNYESSDRQQLEWHYLIAWKNCHNLAHDRSWTPDQDEPSFVFESELQAG
jgi:hypothetical protein